MDDHVYFSDAPDSEPMFVFDLDHFMTRRRGPNAIYVRRDMNQMTRRTTVGKTFTLKVSFYAVNAQSY